MMLNRRSFLAVTSTVLYGFASPVAVAQGVYPSAGPIHLTIPFAPAGSIDILGRIIADGLAKQLGQSVVAENRAGAGGNIGMGAVARAKADGYNLLFTSSVLVVNPLIYKTVPFDPYKDFTPIALLATSPNLLMAKPDFARTLPDFIAKAKAEPGKLNYASPGTGTKGHFLAELLLKLRAGINVTHVPYSSGAQIAQSLMTESTQLGSTALPAGEGFVRGGTLAGLAVTSAKRWPTLPDVPTLAEFYPGFVNELFTALLAPAGTPSEVVQLLTTEVAKMVRDPDVVAKAERAGYEWVGAGPDALRAKMAEEVAQTKEVIESSGIAAR